MITEEWCRLVSLDARRMIDWPTCLPACRSVRYDALKATEIPDNGTQPAPSIQPEVLTRLVFAGVNLKRQRRILNFLSHIFFLFLVPEGFLRYYELPDIYFK